MANWFIEKHYADTGKVATVGVFHGRIFADRFVKELTTNNEDANVSFKAVKE